MFIFSDYKLMHFWKLHEQVAKRQDITISDFIVIPISDLAMNTTFIAFKFLILKIKKSVCKTFPLYFGKLNKTTN